jgi:hypothetical protein
MDVEKLLRSFFNQFPKLVPWRTTFDEGMASEEARKVWTVLDIETRFLISKESPFRKKRKAIIRALSQQGVSCDVLAEISGFNRSSIARICRRLSPPMKNGPTHR